MAVGVTRYELMSVHRNSHMTLRGASLPPDAKAPYGGGDASFVHSEPLTNLPLFGHPVIGVGELHTSPSLPRRCSLTRHTEEA